LTPEQPQTWTFEPAADHDLPPIAAFRSVKREPGFLSFATNAVSGCCFRAFFKVYHRLRVEGRENLPRKTPFVVISNHASHLDALILAASLPLVSRVHTYPVAAGDVFFETIASSMLAATLINALPLWRKKVTTHALDELRERLARGQSGYILFPEGARSRDGNFLPFKAGLGMLVAGTNVPVIPCHIAGAFEALPAFSNFPRPRRIRVRVGAPITFESVPADREGWSIVAERTKDAVARLAAGSQARPIAGAIKPTSTADQSPSSRSAG
jgi:1-acyl-sn-glycerol-3-phosphate acyltransferase